MTFQKVLLPSKAVVGAYFQVVQPQRACGRCTAARAKGLFERYHLSYGFGNMVGWFLNMYLLFEGEKNNGKNVTSFSHSLQHSFMGLSGGTSKVGGRKGEAGKGMLGVSWGTSCQHWSYFPNSPFLFWPFGQWCVSHFWGYPVSSWAVHHYYPAASFMTLLLPHK